MSSHQQGGPGRGCGGCNGTTGCGRIQLTRSANGQAGQGGDTKKNNLEKPLKKQKPESANKRLGNNTFICASQCATQVFIKTKEEILMRVQKTYTKPRETVIAIELESECSFKKETPKDDKKINTSTAKGFMRAKELENLIKTKSQCDANNIALHSLLLKQRSKQVKTKLESWSDWSKLDAKKNGVLLLAAIKDVAHLQDERTHCAFMMLKSLQNFLTITQRQGESAVDCLKQFQIAKDVMVTNVGALDITTAAKKSKTCKNVLNPNDQASLLSEANEQFEAFLYLSGAKGEKAEGLKDELCNDHAKLDDDHH